MTRNGARDARGTEVYPGCSGKVCLPEAQLCAERKQKVSFLQSFLGCSVTNKGEAIKVTTVITVNSERVKKVPSLIEVTIQGQLEILFNLKSIYGI